MSTGQGFIGFNMFAYCLNNPIKYFDDTGCLARLVPSLWDFYQIHRGVQERVVDDYGYAMEVNVISWKGNGRLDLYDAVNNQFYEVKTFAQINTKDTNRQIERYEESVVLDGRFLAVAFMESPQKGTNAAIGGSFEYKYWDIYYSYYADGKIYYTWEVNPKRYAKEVMMRATVVSAAIVGRALRSEGGNALVRQKMFQ